jgi:hypothetical protein
VLCRCGVEPRASALCPVRTATGDLDEPTEPSQRRGAGIADDRDTTETIRFKIPTPKRESVPLVGVVVAVEATNERVGLCL